MKQPGLIAIILWLCAMYSFADNYDEYTMCKLKNRKIAVSLSIHILTMTMNRIAFCILLTVAPLALNAQSRKYIDYVDYDMTLFLKRDRKLVPDAMRKYIRPDAATYYPWLYGPAYTMLPNTNPLSPTYCFGRDGDRYYFVISLKETAGFPNADIEPSPFLNILCSGSSVLTLRLDSVTPLIESLWHFIQGTWAHDRDRAVVDDEAFEYPFSSGLSDGYTLAEYHLDIVFDIEDIGAFMSKRPVMFNILGGQYVFDFTDNPKFIRRFAKGMRKSKEKLDKVYDVYHKENWIQLFSLLAILVRE